VLPNYQTKIVELEQLIRDVAAWRLKSRKVVFTNGCFDVFHPGHLHIINQSARLGDKLIVGLNSDSSVKKLKGESRPLHNENARAELLASFVHVDRVVLFSEDTPIEIIQTLKPDYLVKGGDYTEETIVGSKQVAAYGGKIIVVPLLEGHSTTRIVDGLK